MPSAWQIHLSKFRSANPDVRLKEAMQAASKTYTPKSVATERKARPVHARKYRSNGGATQDGMTLEGGIALTFEQMERVHEEYTKQLRIKEDKSEQARHTEAQRRRKLDDETVMSSPELLRQKIEQLTKEANWGERQGYDVSDLSEKITRYKAALKKF